MIQRTALCLAAVAALTVACGPKPLTPEESRAKGEALLKEMSTNAGALQTFAYTADERREVVENGAKLEKHATRRVTMRRPNALTFTTTGDEREGAAWYDGKQVTLVSHREKVWARGPMPPTLDEALDFISEEYAIQMPTADLLYSSPYDALMTPDTTGGWVDVQKVDDRTCDHLAYRQALVDWEIWLNQEGRLPCQVKITYKNEPAQPSVSVVYSNLERTPQVTDDTFAAKIPDGYRRIKIMRHATVEDPSVAAAEAEAAKTTEKAAPKKAK
jgi:hypothetical protein